MRKNIISLLMITVIITCCNSENIKHSTYENQISEKEPKVIIEDSIYYGIKDSIIIDSTYYTKENLKKSTLNFLRYARNEIFAKYGYVFKDECLQRYFENKTWYEPKKSSPFKMNEKDSIWSKVIQRIESEYFTKHEPYKIVARFNFNNKPLFYIASNLKKSYNGNYRFREGHFYLLDNKDLWILDCPKIPIEFILKNTMQKLYCQDDPGILQSKDIKVINFDSSCVNGKEAELFIRLYGPSNDDEHLLVGFNNEGMLTVLFRNVYIQDYKIISNSIVRFSSIDRCDRIGTEFCTIEYDYNSITKTISKITKPEYKHTINSKSLKDSVILYNNRIAAITENSDSISAIVPPNSNVFISSFLDKPTVFYIEYEKKYGWISIDNILKFNIGWAD